MSIILLSNESGLKVELSPFGASIRSIQSPSGQHLVLSYQDENEWFNNKYYLGVTVGRVANRISGSSYKTETGLVSLSANEEGNHLHGGFKGLSSVNWQIDEVNDEQNSVTFSYLSYCGEEGYPGDVLFKVTYQLINNNLCINMRANASVQTPISLTNHVYWQLGNTQNTIKYHRIHLPARIRLEKTEENTPSGEYLAVENTHYDFTQPAILEPRLINRGFDDYYLLDPKGSDELKLHGIIENPENNFKVSVFSTAPGCQFYTGYYLSGETKNITGEIMGSYTGLCIEPHNLPDAVNNKHFLTSFYGPKKPYSHTLVYEIDAH